MARPKGKGYRQYLTEVINDPNVSQERKDAAALKLADLEARKIEADSKVEAARIEADAKTGPYKEHIETLKQQLCDAQTQVQQSTDAVVRHGAYLKKCGAMIHSLLKDKAQLRSELGAAKVAVSNEQHRADAAEGTITAAQADAARKVREAYAEADEKVRAKQAKLREMGEQLRKANAEPIRLRQIIAAVHRWYVAARADRHWDYCIMVVKDGHARNEDVEVAFRDTGILYEEGPAHMDPPTPKPRNNLEVTKDDQHAIVRLQNRHLLDTRDPIAAKFARPAGCPICGCLPPLCPGSHPEVRR